MFARTLTVLVALSWSAGIAAAAEPIDFAKQIEPMLAERCAKCHGEAKAQAKLRLDSIARFGSETEREAAAIGGWEAGRELAVSTLGAAGRQSEADAQGRRSAGEGSARADCGVDQAGGHVDSGECSEGGAGRGSRASEAGSD